MDTGTELIRQERERQVKVEGWSAAHDDGHVLGELARAAACYAIAGVWEVKSRQMGTIQNMLGWIWPATWDTKWWKPRGNVANLVRAGALIAAEIDRLRRIQERERVKKVVAAALAEGFGPLAINRIKWALEDDPAKPTGPLLSVEEAVARQRRELGMDVTAKATAAIEHLYLGHG
jgi:hypothetical protein